MVNEILVSCINLEKLIRNDPKLFNLSKLTSHNKYNLLRYDFDFFFNLLKDNITPNDKYYFHLKTSDYRNDKRLAFTKNDIEGLTNDVYCSLLINAGIKKYFIKEKVEFLSNSQKQDLVMKFPSFMLENISNDKLPKITCNMLSNISCRKPSIIETYFKDLNGYSTDYTFWDKMIAYNNSYKKIFLKNVNTVTTKTEIRGILYKFPEIIKDIDADDIINSKLSVKEWLLIIDRIIKESPGDFIDWQFSDEMKEIFKIDLVAEFLNGKSRASSRTKSALLNVLGHESLVE